MSLSYPVYQCIRCGSVIDAMVYTIVEAQLHDLKCAGCDASLASYKLIPAGKELMKRKKVKK